ncbi:protein DpdH [Polyangium sp. 6x1]|uniref:protein DpdH n=1 Tax=Polyangium sp. 6x1 TaxID=3042689 RepID=UPI0024826B18|nr:protein DpdH [Polyangium sp. 6x1]MDI1450819.1 protein DpdH [Polyangium sp. 6x1]
MNALSWWWPSLSRLNEVLLGDAEAHSPAVALAVHQRMRIRRRHYDEPIDTDRAETVDEWAIFRQLEEPVGDGCQVVLIEGKSGTGKSHVVRWLEIQLDRRARREPREDEPPPVVLPVSKGARLRDIVKQLCDRPELAGDEHAALRQQLSRAQEPVDPKDAASRLCQQLAFVCETRAGDAKRKQAEGRALTALESLQKKWGDPQQLPHLLVYNPLRPLLVDDGRPLRRLVEHLHTKAGALTPRTDQEFVDADLVFDELPDELDKRARQVLRHLEDPDERREAVRVLNDALDDAKRILLNLNPGVVQEVFKSIRRELLRQGKELILLVEDFADLSGLQREVLQAAIQTGAPGGVKTYCTLRTVLAFTDGFVSEHTVLSRAQYVYYVPNQLREDEVVEQSVRLVGAYLHAARFGAAALEKALREASDVERWMPAPPELSDADSIRLEAFGKSGNAPLFPFTRNVVERLVRDTYAGKALLYVPRDVIRDVMPRVLDHREAFERGEFPPKAFQQSRQAQLTDEQAKWVGNIKTDGATRGRLERFLRYWGSNAGAARVFGLPAPDGSNGTGEPDDVVDTFEDPGSSGSNEADGNDEKKGTGGAGGDVPPPVVEPFAAEREEFDAWRRGKDVAAPGERQTIRKAIDASLRPALGWAWRPRLSKSVFATRWQGWQEWIDVAGLRLASDAHAPLTLVSHEARNDTLVNGAVARELAAVRGAHTLKSWDVEGIEKSLAGYLAFVERHRPAVERHLLGLFCLRRWDVLPFLVDALTLTGAMLGVPNCGSSAPDEFIDALFADPPDGSFHDGDWSEKRLKPLREARASLRRLLEQEIGAFQGDADTVHGLDVARLLPFVPAPRREPAPALADPAFPLHATDADAKTITTAVSLLRDRALDTASRAELDERRKLAARVRAYLGPDLDKEALVKALGALLNELKQLDVLTEERASEMRTVVTQLKKAAVVEPLESTDRLVANDASLWQRLVSLGRNEPDIARLANTERILVKVDAFLRDHERHVAASTKIDPLDEAMATHETQLAEARRLLGGVAPATAATEEAL